MVMETYVTFSGTFHDIDNDKAIGDFNRNQLAYFGYPDSNYDDPTNITQPNITPLPSNISISITLNPNITTIDNYTIILTPIQNLTISNNLTCIN